MDFRLVRKFDKSERWLFLWDDSKWKKENCCYGTEGVQRFDYFNFNLCLHNKTIRKSIIDDDISPMQPKEETILKQNI